MQAEEKFKERSRKQIANLEFREKTALAYDKLEKRRKEALSVFQHLDLARQRAAYVKWKVNESLDKFLIEFEASVIRKGGKVIWAYDAETACNELFQLVQKNKHTDVFTDSSAILSEIAFNQFLKSKKLAARPIQIADFVLAELKKEPFNQQLPVFEASFQETKRVLNDSIRHTLEADANEMLQDIRNELRPSFNEDAMVITGANFLLSDSGQVVFSEDSGALFLSSSLAKTHIVVAGIDQLLPGIQDLDLFLSLYSTHKSNTPIQAFSTITGPKDRNDLESTGEFIVVLVDNGRSQILSASEQRQALSCIDCGACNNVCPVYRSIGSNQTFQTAKAGPLSMVWKPLQGEIQDWSFLSEHSTSCGRCTSVCPVQIDLHNHIIRNRKEKVTQGLLGAGDKVAWYSWLKLMLNRKNMNRQTALRNFSFRTLFRKEFGEDRELPKIADKTFNQLWREKHGI